MFWKSKRVERKSSKKQHGSQRRLRFEGLENRVVMAGDVTVALAGTVLTLTGDASNNSVQMSNGAQPGEFVLTGLSGTQINGSTSPMTVPSPFSTLNVNLGVGSDTFAILGPAAKMQLAGTVNINNDSGTDINSITNVNIGTDLNVMKAGNGEGVLMIHGSKVAGNANVTSGGFDGSNTVVIDLGSEVQGNFSITNNEGEDSFIASDATIFGNLSINNGAGDTTTQIGMSAPGAIAVWGSVNVTNGEGYDKVFVNNATLWQELDIDNGDGNTMVSFQSSEVGKGNTASDAVISNGAGIDTLEFTATKIRRDLTITNGMAADLFGSQSVFSGTSRVGRNLTFNGDNGADTFNMNDGTTIAGNSTLNLFNSNNVVTLSGSTIQGVLAIIGGANRDEVTLTGGTSGMRVEGDTNINLNAGVDLLELLTGTELIGATNVDGGTEIDTLRRTATIAAPLNITGFENQE